ncbi:MAG: flagellar biosynthesis protein FlhB [Candidatus Omnitrophota bacterium]
MAESETGQEKTEPATGRKREKAREQGNIPKSQEINTALMLIAGVFSFYIFSGEFYGNVEEAIKYYVGNCHRIEVTATSCHALMLEIGLRLLIIVWPFFLTFMIVGIAINLSQVGFNLVGKPLVPDLKKLNPLTGLGRLFSIRGRIELVKSMFKMFILAPVMVWTVYKHLPEMMPLVWQDPQDIMTQLGLASLDVAIKALLIMFILSLFDYIYQRWQYEQDLKMTKEEVKQEMKDIQGDPQIRSRIRSIQLEMARRRMLEEVPKAEVVVTNPTEYAVALKYESGESPAPQVVAKGKNLLAQKIKEIALEHRIPIVENRPLAQSLYKLVDIGNYIPPELYQAVAEVLAYVYRLTKKIAQKV